MTNQEVETKYNSRCDQYKRLKDEVIFILRKEIESKEKYGLKNIKGTSLVYWKNKN